MKFHSAASILLAATLPRWPQGIQAPCVSSPETAAVLEELHRVRDPSRTGMDIAFETLRIVRAAIAKAPDDFFIRRAHLTAMRHRSQFEGQNAAIARQDALAAANPDSPLLRYFAACVRIGRQSEEALAMLRKLTEDHPRFAWAHLAIAELDGFPAFQDPAKMQ